MKNTSKASLGIDVSKHFLDIHALPDGSQKRYENTPEGLEALILQNITHLKSHIEIIDESIQRLLKTHPFLGKVQGRLMQEKGI